VPRETKRESEEKLCLAVRRKTGRGASLWYIFGGRSTVDCRKSRQANRSAQGGCPWLLQFRPGTAGNRGDGRRPGTGASLDGGACRGHPKEPVSACDGGFRRWSRSAAGESTLEVAERTGTGWAAVLVVALTAERRSIVSMLAVVLFAQLRHHRFTPSPALLSGPSLPHRHLPSAPRPRRDSCSNALGRDSSGPAQIGPLSRMPPSSGYLAADVQESLERPQYKLRLRLTEAIRRAQHVVVVTAASQPVRRARV
jgi:hypothetical protein